MIRVLLLGSPAVFQDGQPLRIQRRIQRVLLMYLACHLEPVSRAELTLMFWPDDSERDARRHLREAISKLRAALPDPSIWVSDIEHIGLDHRRIEVDVIRFQTLMQRNWRNVIQVPLHLPLPEAVFKEMLEALSLWRTPHFLSGINLPSSSELERWLLTLAQDLEYVHQRLQERIAYHYAAIGDLDQAIYWLRQALLVDELNEGLHAQVLEWLGRLGHRSEVLAYVQMLREIYHREVGGLPDSLRSLTRELTRPTAFDAPAPLAWQPVRGLDLPFVGRADLLSTLRLAYQRGDFLVITGEAGAGKTRLVQQFYQTLDPPPRLFYARAHPGESGLAYQPLSDLLRAAITREEWLRLGPAWAAPLLALLPELVEIWPDHFVPGRNPPHAARGRLFEALLQLVRLVAADRPVLCLIDDAHWCDEATLAALAYLDEREVFAHRGLLILAARREERSRALDDFLARPARNGRSTLEVGRLRPGEVAELTHYALGDPPPDELVEQLAVDTGGNPLYLIENMRAWLDGATYPHPSRRVGSLPIPENVRVLLRERLSAFSTRQRTVLTLAAILGREFTPADLEAAAGLSPDALAAALEDLERDHLIAPTPGGSYIFIHDQLRKLLALELSPARRRALHLRAAAALESAPGPLTPAQTAALAAHRAAAGQDLEAYRLWLRAAAGAPRLDGPGPAISAYQHAEQLLSRVLPRLSDAEILALYSPWCELAYELNDPAALEQASNALLAIGEQRGSAGLLGSGLSGLAEASGLRGKYEDALGTLAQATAYLHGSGDLYERILAGVRRGRFFLRLNRWLPALQAFRAAAALVPPAAEARVRQAGARAQAYLSLVYSLTGRPRLALEAGEQALQSSQWSPLPTAQVHPRVAVALAHYFQGRYGEGLAHGWIGLQAGPAAGYSQTGLLQVVIARCLLGLGRLDEAWERSQTAVEFSRRLALPVLAAEALCLQGDLFCLLDDPARAAALYAAGLAEVDGPVTFTGLGLNSRLGSALALTGELEAGRGRVLRGLQLAQQAGLGAVQMMAEVHLAGVEILAGDLPAAEKRLETPRRHARQHNLAAVRIVCDQLAARLHGLRGGLAEAQRLAGRAADAARALQNPLLELMACQELALVQQAWAQDLAPIRQRAGQALEQLDRQTRQPAIRPAFERFRSGIIERIS